MLPINPHLRRLLSKYDPALSSVNFKRYESLLALRHQLIQELHLPPFPTGITKKLHVEYRYLTNQEEIQQVTQKAKDILRRVRPDIRKIKMLTEARNHMIISRQLIFEDLSLSNTKTVFNHLFNYWGKYFYFRFLTFKTLLSLIYHDISYRMRYGWRIIIKKVKHDRKKK